MVLRLYCRRASADESVTEMKLLLAIRTKWYWLKSIYLIKAVFNSRSQQTVTIIEVLKVQMTWKFLLSYLKVLEKSGILPLTVSWYLFSFISYKGLRLEKWSKKWYRGLGKNQWKLIKSVTSCGGHLARVYLSMCHSSVNTCQNQVKLCRLKVQDVVQLAIVKFCFSIKDCRSQASFNDFTIKGLGPKILA